MISNNQSKLIISLQKKKARDKLAMFIIEGDKLVREYLESREEIVLLAGKQDWLDSVPKQLVKRAKSVVELSDDELKKISSLSTPHNSLAIVKINRENLDINKVKGDLCIGLDFIQDPGNLGTIIRIAAWFGIKYVVCSNNCVDLYNPKVIQATMGAILTTKVFYTRMEQFLIDATQKQIPIYATSLDGKSVYQEKLGKEGIILFGNESNGISKELKTYVTQKLLIPHGGILAPGIESLNVAAAASVICSEFIRRKI